MSRDNEHCLWTLCMMFDPVQNTERRDDRAARGGSGVDVES